MPFVSKRRLHALQAQLDRALYRAENAEQDAKEQTGAASRLAQRELARKGSIAGAAAALAAPYREVKAQCERLEQANAVLVRNNLALRGRLWDALGYTDAQRAAIESGKGEPVKTSA